MLGQQTLLAMRRKGVAPKWGVYVDVGQRAPLFDYLDERYPNSVTLWVQPADRLERLDLRCVVALEVVILAFEGERDRAMAAAERCIEANASRVVVLDCTRKELVPLLDSTGELEVRPWQQ